MNIWANNYPDYEGNAWKVGDIGFLVYRDDLNRRGATRYTLQSRPQCTNMSGRPCLDEWCGTTNNVYVAADGLARVARVTGNDRMQLARLPKSEWPAALEALGYPDLDEGGQQ